jgi:HTH-type transcriptional regulator/antitoxin HigA
MALMRTGLSAEFLIHPGESLRELMENEEMNQKELAVRTGFSTKHISKVLSGDYDITSKFAYALENVFSVPAEFWLNMQNSYNIEKLYVHSSDSVTDDEREITSKMSSAIKYLVDTGLMSPTRDKTQKVLELRKILGVNNLTAILSLDDIKRIIVTAGAYTIDLEQTAVLRLGEDIAKIKYGNDVKR